MLYDLPVLLFETRHYPATNLISQEDAEVQRWHCDVILGFGYIGLDADIA
jgi:hypothetical protein